jgi:hypothetical protein
MKYSKCWKEKILEWVSGANFLPAPATNSKTMIVSLWSGDRVVATQPAEFVDGVNADTIDFGTVNPERDKYWLNDIGDREDIETNLRESGLAPQAQFEGTFEA